MYYINKLDLCLLNIKSVNVLCDCSVHAVQNAGTVRWEAVEESAVQSRFPRACAAYICTAQKSTIVLTDCTANAVQNLGAVRCGAGGSQPYYKVQCLGSALFR